MYALGVLLYELLCGAPPFEPSELELAGLYDLQRRVCELDPLPPSKRRRRSTVPERRTWSGAQESIPPELDWIALRCLEKERTRRYGSAEALAEDVSRFLGHEPVEAAPPSAFYRLRKLVRRHRAASAALCVALASTSIGAAVAGVGLVVARAGERRAEQEHARVLRLSAFQELEDLRRLAGELWPVSPELVGEYERWLERADALLAGREPDPESGEPGHRGQLALLRSQASPQTEAERRAARAEHPRAAELEGLRARLAATRAARAVMLGEADPEEVALDTATLPVWNSSLTKAAFRLVEPGRAEYGREAEGLALARVALERAEGEELVTAADTLAWALLANGLVDEAAALAEELPELAPPERVREFELDADAILTAVEDADALYGAEVVAGLERELAQLESTVAGRYRWEFEREESRWWHARLVELLDAMAELEDPETGLIRGVDPELGWGIERRLALARAMEESGPAAAARASWREAVRAIADVQSAPAYRGARIAPQRGLVPLGADPRSGLWEFAELASGEVPERGPDGALVLDERSALVLVLVPGGRFRMGAQSFDPAGADYDPGALSAEGPPHEVELAPFFVAKHELTQAQWTRLAGANPSQYQDGMWGSREMGPRHPVENLTWAEAERTLARFGLALPTEAQWEYAARGGTTTPWSTGARAASLAGHANLNDRSADGLGSPWNAPEGWLADGHAVHAPVGSFAPNPYGLHDAHGNVAEMCREPYASYYDPVLGDGTGARPGGEATERVARGGAFNLPATEARSAARFALGALSRTPYLGVRPVRPLAGPVHDPRS